MIRNAAVAGRFYPGTSGALRAEIKRLVDNDAHKESALGVISPHAGYMYSGPVAGATFSRIEFTDTFVILGPNHTGQGSPFSIMKEGSWVTPLGEVSLNSELAGRILDGSENLEEDAVAHKYEHSIEVQVPFLQYFRPDVKIVPILLSASVSSVYKDIGRGIAGAIRELSEEVMIIASSDMTHYEPQDSARARDAKALEAIIDLDEDLLMSRVQELNITMCGYGPVICLISAARELGASQAELVRYQTSGDVTGDLKSVVGYAGVIIR